MFIILAYIICSTIILSASFYVLLTIDENFDKGELKLAIISVIIFSCLRELIRPLIMV